MCKRQTPWGTLLCGLLIQTVLTGTLFAQERLSQKLDEILARSSSGVIAAMSSDHEFVRRVYLDLAGRVPSPNEARSFLADPAADKRARLIDRLLASPDFARYFAGVLDVMINERRPDKGISAAEWQKYLFDSLIQNKPFDQLAREILSADGADPVLRPAVKFYLDREGEANVLTRDVGRVFFGIDLQCAQCHDHPLIDDYYQTDYYGLLAFLNRSFVFTDKKDNNKLYFAEKADGDVAFSSVFTKKSGLTGPRLPYGSAVSEVTFNPGEEYNVAPAENVRPVPKYSRRAQLATLATDGKNIAFNRNIANRLWAHLMGRGLVEPLDLSHGGNPASHPEVLELLAEEIVRMKFDLRAMLREVANSQAYQRAYEFDFNSPAAAAQASQQLAAWKAQEAELKPIAELSLQSLQAMTNQRDAANEAIAPLVAEMGKATTAVTAALQARQKAEQALEDSKKQLVIKQEQASAVSAAATSSQAAVKQLPDDKELQSAAEKFAAKAVQLNNELATVSKATADLEGPAKAAADAFQATRNLQMEVAGRLSPLQKQLDTAIDEWRQAAEKSRHEQQRLKDLATRVDDAETIIKFNAMLADSDVVKQRIGQINTEIVQLQQTMETAAAAMAGLQAEMQSAQLARDDAEKVRTESAQQVSEKLAVAKTVADAAAQAENARLKLPDDAELAQAAQNIKTRSEQLLAQASELQAQLAIREQQAKTTAEKLAAVQQAAAAMANQVETSKTQLPALQSQLAGFQEKQQQAAVTIPQLQQVILQRSSERFFASNLRAQSPEQMAWSVMQVAGVLDAHRAEAEAELNKSAPLDDAARNDPVKLDERARQVNAAVFEKLKGNVGAFVNLFGTGPGQPAAYFATVDQALFFSNGGTIAGWLAPSGGNLTDRLLKLEDGKALAEELYLTVLCRRPAVEEIEEVVRYLATRPSEKSAAVQELAWSLLASAEFRFNH